MLESHNESSVDPATSVDFTLGWLAIAGVLCALVAVRSDRWRLSERLGNLPQRQLVAGVFAAAFLLRLVPAIALNLPADALVRYDIDSFRIVGDLLRGGGDIYAQPERYPYLPFQAYLFATAGWLADVTPLSFLLLVKLPQIAADAGIAALLLTWPGGGAKRNRKLATVYALNPATMLIASIHGQFDSLPLFFLVLSAWLLLRLEPGDRRAVFAGLALGVAILTKTWPAMALPLLAWHAGDWRERGRFVAAAAVAPLVASGAYAVYLALQQIGPGDAIRAVTYDGISNQWGYLLLLDHLRGDLPGISALADLLADVAEPLLVLGVVGATLLATGRSLPRGMLLVLLAFYALTPGWGMHWLIWAIPFVLLGASGISAASYVALVSVTLGLAAYGYGGVHYGLLEHFSLNSPVVAYRWAFSLPAWALCTIFAALLAAEPWFERRGWLPGAQRELPEAAPLDATLPTAPGS